MKQTKNNYETVTPHSLYLDYIKKTIAVSKETGDKTVLIKEVIKLPTPGFSVVTDGLFENNNIIIKNKNLSLLIFRD